MEDEPCPLGLTSDGYNHAMVETDDVGYLWRCPCGAERHGFVVNLRNQGPRVVSIQQMQKFIKAGLRVPQDLRDFVNGRVRD